MPKKAKVKEVNLVSLIQNMPKTIFRQGVEHFLTITANTRDWLISYRSRATNTDLVVASQKDIISALEKASKRLEEMEVCQATKKLY